MGYIFARVHAPVWAVAAASNSTYSLYRNAEFQERAELKEWCKHGSAMHMAAVATNMHTV